MSYKEILDDIKNNSLKDIYLFYGMETYLKNWIVTMLKEKYIDKSFETLNYTVVDGKEIKIDGVINACETLPFMADKKIVIVDNPTYFNNSSNEDKKSEEELIKYIEKASEFTCLVFLIDEEKIDNRKKTIKKIKENGRIIEFNKLSSEELNKWIMKKFKENNKKINSNDIFYIIQSSGYLENNSSKTLYDIDNEITKMISFIGEKDSITREDIDKVITKSLQNNIFKLVDGIGQKRPEISIKMLNEMLLENEPIQVIMYMIVRQFRLLYMAKLLDEKGYSQGDIGKKLGIHGFIAKKVVSQCRNFSTNELKETLNKCLEADKAIKTGLMDSKLAVETLIVNI